MLTITLKTLQQQTFKIEIDPELTVSNTLEFPCPSKWATARARGTGKYRGLVVSNLNMKGDTILNHVAIHAIWEWHSVFCRGAMVLPMFSRHTGFLPRNDSAIFCSGLVWNHGGVPSPRTLEAIVWNLTDTFAVGGGASWTFSEFALNSTWRMFLFCLF